jgi:hypothetical protein
MVALLISQNGPENLSPAGALGKLPRDLTEPAIMEGHWDRTFVDALEARIVN